jgi:hypothetical protein
LTALAAVEIVAARPFDARPRRPYPEADPHPDRPSMRRHAAPLALLAALAVVSCRAREAAHELANMPRDTAVTLGPGDVLITTTDSAVDLALNGDKVFMRISEKLRASIRDSMESKRTDSASGALGSAIGSMVKSAVSSAMSRRLELPVASIDSVTYDGERLAFAYREHRNVTFDNWKSDRKAVLERFRPEDARRFADAFRARKAQLPAPRP